MRKKEPKKKTNYDAITWRNFPTDKTLSAFLGEYREETQREKLPSVIWIKGAVNALESEDEKKPVYNDLFSPRQIDFAMSHTTAPRLIPYEIQQLLFAIATVRDENKALRGDEFAERVFSVLVKNMEQNMNTENFVDTLMLNQFRIQQELLRKFENVLHQRFDLLHQYIFSNPEGSQINKLKHVLEQIDYLLTDFLGNSLDATNSSAKQDLQTLYVNLLTMRKEVITEEVIKNGRVEKMNWKDVDDPLVQKMNEQLLQTSRSPKPTEITDFLYNYNEYLMRYVDPDIKAQSEAFSESYSKLHDYYVSNIDAEQFEEIVQSELSVFSQAIFDELDKMDQVGAASNYQPKSAAVGYLRLRLTQIHEEILNKIQEALRMLRAVYSLLFFSDVHLDKNTYNQDRIRAVSNRMIVLAATMLEECQPMLPHIENTMTWAEKILSAYDHVVSPVYEEEISGAMLEQLMYVLSTEPSSSVHYLFAMANLLRRMCMVYVRCECIRCSKLLVEEFKQMQKLLSV